MRRPKRERRESRRAPAETLELSQAKLRHGPELLLIDVGEGGALVEASARMLPGSQVELQLASEAWGWSGRARVLRCQVSALLPEQGVRYRAALGFDRPLRLSAARSAEHINPETG